MATFRPHWIPEPKPRKRPPETEQDRKIKAFYSSEPWIALRDHKRRLNPRCEACEEIDIVSPVAIVHHVKPVRTHWDLRLTLGNLMSLCSSHHEQFHKSDRRK